MNHDNPFFMNFDFSDFMSKFASPSMDSEYSKKLVDAHQKNLDCFVKANQVIGEGYKSIASRQMEIFQESLTKMAGFNPEQAAEHSQKAFEESAEQMKDLIDLATQAHKDAFNVLSSRAKDIASEIRTK